MTTEIKYFSNIFAIQTTTKFKVEFVCDLVSIKMLISDKYLTLFKTK